MATARKSGLGSKGLGLGALIHSEADDLSSTNERVVELDMNQIEPNRSQPRKRFEEEALEALAESIKACGVIQPILVKKEGDAYLIIAGERRWRASKIAGLRTIPAIIREVEDETLFQLALVENLQREDLNPLEEAEGYCRLKEEFGLSQEEIAKKVGKSRSAIANAMRLMQLDERVKQFIVEGRLSGGHARALLSLEEGKQQFEVAEHILEEGLSVRATEQMVKRLLELDKQPPKAQKTEKQAIDQLLLQKAEQEMQSVLGTKVKVKSGEKKGKIEIEFYSPADLDRLLLLLHTIQRT